MRVRVRVRVRVSVQRPRRRLLAVDDVHDHAALLEDREGAADGGVHLVRVRVRVRG